MYKKFKILGLLFLALILTFTMTACDNGTQSSLNEIEKTGSLIVTSKDLQFSTQGNISPANVIENQFLNYKIKVKIVHDRTGREKSQVIDVSIDDLKNNTDENYFSVQFNNILTGKWNIVDVSLEADHETYGNTKIMIPDHNSNLSANIEPAKTETVNVTLVQNNGGINFNVDNIDWSDISSIELREPGNTTIYDNNSISNPAESFSWTDLKAKQYVIYVEPENASEALSQSIMVLPGIIRDVNIKFYSGDGNIQLVFDLPPAAPETVYLNYNNGTCQWELSWDRVSEANSYNIVRREISPEGRNNWTTVATGVNPQNSSNYTFVDETNSLNPNINYEYAVITEKNNLNSDYSTPVKKFKDNEGSIVDNIYGKVYNEDTGYYYNNLSTAVEDGNTSSGDTIIVGEGNYSCDFTIDKELTIVGPNANIAGYESRINEAVINGKLNIATSNVTINGLKINVEDAGEKTGIVIDTNGSDIDGVNINNNIINGDYKEGNEITQNGIYVKNYAPENENYTVENTTISYNKIENLKYGITVRHDVVNTIIDNNKLINNNIAIRSYSSVKDDGTNNPSIPLDTKITDNTIVNNIDWPFEDNTLQRDVGILMMAHPEGEAPPASLEDTEVSGNTFIYSNYSRNKYYFETWSDVDNIDSENFKAQFPNNTISAIKIKLNPENSYPYYGDYISALFYGEPIAEGALGYVSKYESIGEFDYPVADDGSYDYDSNTITANYSSQRLNDYADYISSDDYYIGVMHDLSRYLKALHKMVYVEPIIYNNKNYIWDSTINNEGSNYVRVDDPSQTLVAAIANTFNNQGYDGSGDIKFTVDLQLYKFNLTIVSNIPENQELNN